MANTISNAFVTQWASEAHLLFQQYGSKLRHTVRLVTEVNGSSFKFQKIAKGTATTKTRNAQLSAMDPAESVATATLSDYYAGQWIDKLDVLKIKHDERDAMTRTIVGALGRQYDSQIATCLDTQTTNSVSATGTGTGFGKTAVRSVFENLNENDVPDDGERWLVLGPWQWDHLLGVTEFASADYITDRDLPWLTGATAKRWLGFNILMSNQLNDSGDYKLCHAYHRMAIGGAEGTNIVLDIQWHNDQQWSL